ncbi:MAG: aminodeoxychorismate synthase component I [Gemmatimonadota bacterium]
MELPIVQELSPCPDPIETASILGGLPYLLFLDSASSRSPVSRYSFLTADPAYLIRSRGGVTTRTMTIRGETTSIESDPLQAAHDVLAPYLRGPVAGLPPFQGGAAGYLGYEFGGTLEKLPLPRFNDLDLPDTVLGIYDWVIAWDHQAGQAWLVSNGLPDVGPAQKVRAEQRMRFVLGALNGSPGRAGRVTTTLLSGGTPAFPVMENESFCSTFTEQGYQAAVRQVIEYILAGDVFQVNIAQRFEAPFRDSPFALYQKLRAINPAPFSAYLDFGDAAIASASPERFLRFDPATRMVETRPIKGTRPRGRTPAEDITMIEALQSSAKDRAENVMIVDLLRNDLSRVCRPGSVQVPSLLAIETHPTVHHLVSTIVGQLEDDRTVRDLIRAAFPGGSITGAPKIRAMEIISELEPTRRGPYCGSIGYWSLTGAMDSSIVIRTCIMVGERAYFHAGGGIVADSDPSAEYRETMDKAKALMDALSANESPSIVPA